MTLRSGAALVIALLVLLLIETMTAGLLALSTQSRMVAAARMRSARAHSTALFAARAVLASWETGSFDTLPPGTLVTSGIGTGSLGDLTYATTIERLRRTTYIIRAAARVGSEESYSAAHTVAVARTLDRLAVLEESNNALASGGATVVAGASRISADLIALPPAWSDSLCPAPEPLPAPGALLTARTPTISASAAIDGPVSVDSTLAAIDSTLLGGMRWEDVEAIADRIERGTIAPAPVTADSVCDRGAAANWGDPGRPDTACGKYYPLIFARGDLTVSGGAGQGILVVRGTLTLAGGATFVGVAVALNGFTLDGGSRVIGSLQSRAGYALLDNATVLYSRCAVARALSATPAARRLILGDRTFIPAF